MSDLLLARVRQELMIVLYRSDLAFLAMPPAHLASIAPALTSALATLRTLASDFEGNFVYVKGFDSYTVKVRALYVGGVPGLTLPDLRSASVKASRIQSGRFSPAISRQVAMLELG